MAQRTIEFSHNGSSYTVAFEQRMQKTKNLVKRGIIQPRKSKRKQQEMPEQMRCTHCTVIQNNRPVATGMAVCSPRDKFNSTTGRKTALQKTIQRSRQELKVTLNKDWATEAWQQFFEAETPNARACRKRKCRSAKA